MRRYEGVDDADVAPFTGAWIETVVICGRYSVSVVAPFTGAWIETRPAP